LTHLPNNKKCIISFNKQKTAYEINERNNPADPRKVDQDNPINQQRRRHSKRNDIGERIELATEGAVLSPQASEPAVEYIKNTGAENEPDGRMKKRRRFVGTGPLNQCALDDLERGS